MRSRPRDFWGKIIGVGVKGGTSKCGGPEAGVRPSTREEPQRAAQSYDGWTQGSVDCDPTSSRHQAWRCLLSKGDVGLVMVEGVNDSVWGRYRAGPRQPPNSRAFLSFVTVSHRKWHLGGHQHGNACEIPEIRPFGSGEREVVRLQSASDEPVWHE